MYVHVQSSKTDVIRHVFYMYVLTQVAVAVATTVGAVTTAVITMLMFFKKLYFVSPPKRQRLPMFKINYHPGMYSLFREYDLLYSGSVL